MSRRPTKSELPPLAEPFLQALDRLQGSEQPVPDQVIERATSLLDKRFGPSQVPSHAAFASGSLGLLAGHTQYFQGFAVTMAIAQGVAVAVRSADGSAFQLAFEGEDQAWSWSASGEASDWPVWSCVARRVVEQAMLREPVEIAVVGTIPPACIDAYLAALGVACQNALGALQASPGTGSDGREDTAVDVVHEAIMRCEGFTTSIAYPIAVAAADAPHFTLIDTKTREHLPLKAPSRENVGWGLVTLEEPVLRPASFHRDRTALARRALTTLQAGDFPHINSFRELEHRDLQRALNALPHELTSVARHLVTENRRVHRLVHSVRHQDWQMFGALLMMSHASLRTDWHGTTNATDLVVDVVQTMTLEGMHGACITGRGSSVLVVGRPFSVPNCLDRISATLKDRLDIDVHTMLL